MENFEAGTIGTGFGQDHLSFWETVALTRWGQYVSSTEERILLQAHELAGRHGRVLDYGCGEGRWSQMLSKLGWEPVCVDADAGALAECQRRNSQFDCRLVDPENKNLPAEDRSVNLLLCVEVRSVLDSAWFQSEADRVLADNGLIFGVAFNRNSFRGIYRHWMDRLTGRKGFYNQSFRSLKKSFARRDIHIVHAEGLCWFPLPRASNSALVSAFTGLEKSLGLRSLLEFSPWVIFIAQRNPREAQAGRSSSR